MRVLWSVRARKNKHGRQPGSKGLASYLNTVPIDEYDVNIDSAFQRFNVTEQRQLNASLI